MASYIMWYNNRLYRDWEVGKVKIKLDCHEESEQKRYD